MPVHPALNSSVPIRPCHTAAILSRETEKALFYHAKPRLTVLTAWLGVVKQSFFGLPGQYGRRMTRANLYTWVWGGTVKVKSLAQELYTVPLARVRTRSIRRRAL